MVTIRPLIVIFVDVMLGSWFIFGGCLKRQRRGLLQNITLNKTLIFLTSLPIGGSVENGRFDNVLMAGDSSKRNMRDRFWPSDSTVLSALSNGTDAW